MPLSQFTESNMHASRIGVILCLLALMNTFNVSQGKAFPDDAKYGGKHKYHYNQEVGKQFQPYYSRKDFSPKSKLYYTPQINGQPIFVPSVRRSESHVKRPLDDYYQRNEEYTQRWTFATPVAYEYDESPLTDYHENHDTSSNIAKNLFDEKQRGAYRGSYLFPGTKENSPKHVKLTTESSEYMKHKDKSNNKAYLHTKDERNPNVDSLGIFTENPVFVQYEVETEIAENDYAPELIDVFNKLSNDEDYAPKVVDVVNKLSNDEDYAPEVVDVVNKLSNDEDYAPEVVDVVNKLSNDEDYAPEVVDVVNFKKHGNQKLYTLNKELLCKNVDNKDCDETIVHDSFKLVKDKVKSQDKKKLKKQCSSSNAAESEVITSVNKKPNKPKHKKHQPEEKSTESNCEQITTVEIKTDSIPVSENSDEFYKPKKTGDSSMKPDVASNLKVTLKETKSTVKPESKYDSKYDKAHKVIKRNDKGTFTDDAERHWGKGGKTKYRISSDQNSKQLPENELYADKSCEKLKDIDSFLSNHERIDIPEGFEEFDLEDSGSGALLSDENSSSGPQFFHNMNSIRSLSSLNSNMWSLIFNPNAERKKLKKCITRSNETGYCMYVQQCEVPDIATSLEQLLNNACVMDEIFIGICCPEFPVQTVKVHWEQMPSNSDKHTEDEFGHDTDDCGIRSEEASKAQSWPWKAPLISMSNGKVFCGGVVINEDYILTAAHCTTKIPKNQILVRLGQHDESSGEDFAVVEIKRHAQYNPRNMHNDIALLKLGRRIVRDEHTGPICLPDDDDDDDHAGEKALLLGWQRSFGKRSEKVEFLQVMKNEECEKNLGIKLPVTLLCTEARIEDERICNADSGSPLVVEDDDKYEVIGILSWNRNDCDQRFPSTFSRVSKYVPWVRKHAV